MKAPDTLGQLWAEWWLIIALVVCAVGWSIYEKQKGKTQLADNHVLVDVEGQEYRATFKVEHATAPLYSGAAPKKREVIKVTIAMRTPTGWRLIGIKEYPFSHGTHGRYDQYRTSSDRETRRGLAGIAIHDLTAHPAALTRAPFSPPPPPPRPTMQRHPAAPTPRVRPTADAPNTEIGWNAFWAWAREHGYGDRVSIDSELGYGTHGMTPSQIRRAMVERGMAAPFPESDGDNSGYA